MAWEIEQVGFSETLYPGEGKNFKLYLPGEKGAKINNSQYSVSGELMDLWACWELDEDIDLVLAIFSPSQFDYFAAPIRLAAGSNQLNLMDSLPRSRRIGGITIQRDFTLQARLPAELVQSSDRISFVGMAVDTAWVPE